MPSFMSMLGMLTIGFNVRCRTEACRLLRNTCSQGNGNAAESSDDDSLYWNGVTPTLRSWVRDCRSPPATAERQVAQGGAE